MGHALRVTGAGATPEARRDQGREAVRQVGSLPPFPRFCPRPGYGFGPLYLIDCWQFRLGGCGKPKGKPSSTRFSRDFQVLPE
jgi:hypothetical protein